VGGAGGGNVGSLLVLKDADGVVFGAWIGERIKEVCGSYYGSGDSFLWKADPPSSSSNSEAAPVKLKTFKWTGKNDYVALCSDESISFGGGEGHYGLYLSSSLIEGSSAWCPTFDNEVLCGLPEELTELTTSGGAGGAMDSADLAAVEGEFGGGKIAHGKVKDVQFDCVGVELWAVGMGG